HRFLRRRPSFLCVLCRFRPRTVQRHLFSSWPCGPFLSICVRNRFEWAPRRIVPWRQPSRRLSRSVQVGAFVSVLVRAFVSVLLPTFVSLSEVQPMQLER